MSLLITVLVLAVLLMGLGLLAGRRRLRRLADANARLSRENAKRPDGETILFEQIQATLANLREAVVIIDENKKIRLANPAFSDLSGQADTPIGRRLELYISGTCFQEFLGRMEAGEEGGRMEMESSVGGKTRWLDVSMAPLPRKMYPDSRYTLIVFHDITRQKGLEKMRTEFVANVSHELRTPVTVIKGFAETLREDHAILGEEEKLRFLEKIHSHAKRLDGLLRDLLLLARLESAEMALEKEPLSLSAFLTGQKETWETILEGSGGILEMEFEEGDDYIQGDPLRLTQVLTNLLRNAVLHARGFSKIRLKTRLEDSGVLLSVADNGAGIPEKELPNVFQRFYRVEKGRSRDSGGTGLGLSIAKHIVVQHGGTIEARATEGGGVTVEMQFPRKDSR